MNIDANMPTLVLTIVCVDNIFEMLVKHDLLIEHRVELGQIHVHAFYGFVVLSEDFFGGECFIQNPLKIREISTIVLLVHYFDLS